MTTPFRLPQCTICVTILLLIVGSQESLGVCKVGGNQRDTRLLQTANETVDAGGCVLTGNSIDDCWRLNANWSTDRTKLAGCSLGYAKQAWGGKNGAIYTVTNASDDAVNPTNGTLRYGVIQTQPLWIVFSKDMSIKLQQDLVFVNDYKTVDGRGVNVEIKNGAGLVLEGVSNVIIHGIKVYNIVYNNKGGQVRVSPTEVQGRGSAGEDGIKIINNARLIWIDHCYLANGTDGLIDVTRNSTDVTLSNNLFENHDKVILLGADDGDTADVNMRVTVTLNRFGKGLTQRMPRCRFGQFHVVNNDYLPWGSYAVGGSANATINSEANRYTAGDHKEVTKRMDDTDSWKSWNWRSEGDLFLNGSFFTESGSQDASAYAAATSLPAKSASMVAAMTADAGPLQCKAGAACCSQAANISDLTKTFRKNTMK